MYLCAGTVTADTKRKIFPSGRKSAFDRVVAEAESLEAESLCPVVREEAEMTLEFVSRALADFRLVRSAYVAGQQKVDVSHFLKVEDATIWLDDLSQSNQCSVIALFDTLVTQSLEKKTSRKELGRRLFGCLAALSLPLLDTTMASMQRLR